MPRFQPGSAVRQMLTKLFNSPWTEANGSWMMPTSTGWWWPFSPPILKKIWRLRQLGSFPQGVNISKNIWNHLPSITYALKYPSNKKVYYSIFGGNSYYSIDIPWVLCWIGNHINKLCVLGSLDVQDPSSTTKQNNCWFTAHISKVSMTFIYTIYLYQHLLPVNTSVPIYIYNISLTTLSQKKFLSFSHLFPKKSILDCPNLF